MKASLKESLSFPVSTLDICMLSKRCKALRMGAFTLGSDRSKYTTSFLVMVSRKNHLQLRIRYFLQCTIRQGSNMNTIWVATVSFYHAGHGLVFLLKSGVQQLHLMLS